MKIARVLTAAAVLAALGAGCAATEDLKASEPVESSTQTVEKPAPEPAEAAEPEKADLTVTETAFGLDDSSSTWWYVVILENPNADAIWQMAGIDVEATDAAGTILDSSSDYVTLLSGKTALTGTFFNIGAGQIASLNVRGPDASTAVASAADETGGLTMADIAPVFGDYTTDVTGTVASNFVEDQELVEVQVIARNPAGQIIGGEFAYVDRLPAGGKAQYSVSFFDTLPRDTTFEAYANL